MSPVAKIAYRADIDGLRAIAVFGVVLYHAFPRLCPTGFIGVDIFFVISGFLITTILQDGILDRDGGFLKFCERRVERLVPALITVCLAVSIAGWVLLFPPELESLGKHLAACLTFTSNFALWNEAGYFDADALVKPLRMLWSLAIEEQFYLIWPISFWYLARRGQCSLVPPLIALLISFSVCLLHSGTDAAAAYYSPLSRMWEPLLGCALAIVQRQKVADRAVEGVSSNAHEGLVRRNIWGMVGMLCMLASFFAIPNTAQYPGFWALIPTASTALLIAAGPEASASVLLGWTPLVWIGRISYPLYLWHWPILSFMRIVHGEEPSIVARVIAVFGAAVLALGTYVLVERPIRQKRSVRTALLLVGLFGLAAGATGYAFVEGAGLPGRSTLTNAVPGPIGDRALNEYFSTVYSEFGSCTGPLKAEAARFHQYIRCFESKPGLPIDVAIIGDSHAENYFLGIAEALPKKNVAMYMAGSIPLANNIAFDHMYRETAENHNIKTVIIASFWSPLNSRNNYPANLDATVADTLKPLLSSGKKVYLTDDTPNFSFDASHCKYRRFVEWGPDRCEENAEFFRSQQRAYLPAFQRIADHNPDLRVLVISDLFCTDKICRMRLAKDILFRDRDHLNVEGSREVGARILESHPELAN